MPGRSICVFAGARPAREPDYARAAEEVAAAAAARGLGLVYGGGGAGMMGVLAEAAIVAGVHIVGVAPRFLAEREALADGLSELVVADSMAERKRIMFERAAAFLTLPGGLGTYDELFEAMSASYLDLHDKPCGVLNVNGYFDPLGPAAGHRGRGGLHRTERPRTHWWWDADPARLVDRPVPPGIRPPRGSERRGPVLGRG